MEVSNLRKIGFINFEHIDKDKRDGIVRMIWNGLYKKELLSLIIKQEEHTWVLDKIVSAKYQLEIDNNYFYKSRDIDTVINFINKI